jgi:uncharacterized protein with LGFP repeats
MKTIMLIIAALALAACNKDQTPQQSVEQFKEAQSAVQAAADAAKPHVEAVFDQVIKPAIDQVKADASAQTKSKRQQAGQPAAIPPARFQRVESGWNVVTEFTYCYRDSWLKYPNLTCYSNPQH